MSRSSVDDDGDTTIGYAPSSPADAAELGSSREKAAVSLRAPTVPAKKIFHIEESDTGVRWIATRIGEAVAEILRGRATVSPADVSPRRGRKESDSWRSEEGASASLVPTHMPENGDSSWSDQEAKNLVASMRARRKRKGSKPA
jgi:hypothetical protein